MTDNALINRFRQARWDIWCRGPTVAYRGQRGRGIIAEAIKSSKPLSDQAIARPRIINHQSTQRAQSFPDFPTTYNIRQYADFGAIRGQFLITANAPINRFRQARRDGAAEVYRFSARI